MTVSTDPIDTPLSGDIAAEGVLSDAELVAVMAAGQQPAETPATDIASAGLLIDACDAILAAPSDQRFTALAEVFVRVGCSRVAVASREQSDLHRIEAIVPPLAGDHDDLAAAADETVLLNTVAAWPTNTRLDRPARRAIEQAAVTLGCDQLLCVPVRDDQSHQLVLLLADPPVAVSHAATLLSPSLGLAVRVREESQRSVWSRLKRSAAEHITPRRRRIATAAALLVAAVLSCPFPYASSCDCQLEPQLRRFVAAPFDGRLDTVDVRPGDVVTTGQQLASMDNRDIEHELEGLFAERDKAERERMSQLARRNVSAAQIAKLEGERIAARIDVLADRRDRLAVTSPIDGLVIDGDLDRVRGMPLETGHSLFEIAPLSTVICEVHVPEYDFDEVRAGQPVSITLDARLWEPLEGTVSRVRPRAEDRDGRPAFIAEVELPNPGLTLRPGMTGDAKVTTAWHPLAWNWLHRWYGEFRRGW